LIERLRGALAAALPTGVVTFCLTDIEGSTTLWETHPDEMSIALARHETIVADCVESHGGRLIKTRGEGDSTVSVFVRATDAAAAALSMQKTIGAEHWPGNLRLAVRAALHTGEAELREGDYYGPTLNRAARIRGLATAGQVLCSRATHDLVVDRLPPGTTVSEAGTFELKGLSRKETLFALASDDASERNRDVRPGGAIRYARSSGGIDIAFQAFGDPDGPRVVLIPGFTSHLEINWELPPYAPILEALGNVCSVVVFDKRGTGLSGRDLGFGTVADRMDDVRAVMDAVGWDSAYLLALSEGGPLALLFAASNPARVKGLALYGTGARFVVGDDYPFGVAVEDINPFLAFVTERWGTGEVLAEFIVDTPAEHIDDLARFERNASTPQLTADVMRANIDMDVRDALPQIRVPALVVHAAGDPMVDVRGARYLAEHLPNAKYVEFDDAMHGAWAYERYQPIADGVLDFLFETSPPPVAFPPAPPEKLPFPALLRSSTVLSFAGRHAELELLRDSAVRASTNAAPQTALVVGEPGIGKTRLVGEFVSTEHTRGALVLYGRCDEGMAAPFQPFVEALEWYVAHSERLITGDDPEALARVSNSLQRAIAAQVAVTTTDPESDQLRLFNAYASWLTELSRQQPIVLALDDIHWATNPTLLLLHHVAAKITDARVLVVATYRDTEVEPAHALASTLADLRKVSSVTRIPLGGLGIEDIAAVLGPVSSQDGEDRTTEVAAKVHAETEGNAFFVGEVIQHLADIGVLVPDDSGWTATRAIADAGIPEGVKEVVGQRLRRLGNEATRVLQGAAVAGRDFSVSEVAAASGATDNDVIAALEGACDAHLVLEVGSDRFRFAHALVRATLLDGMSESRRLRMHHAIAEHLEQTDSSNVVDLAHHWCAAAVAGDPEKAVAFSLKAAEQAKSQGAYDDAVSMLERAITVIPRDDDSRLLEVLLALGAAQVTTGDTERYQATFRSAAELAILLDDPQAYARAILGYLGREEIIRHLDDFARPGLEQALRQIDRGDDPGLVSELLGALAAGLANWEPERSVELSAECLALARHVESHEVLCGALRARLRCYWDPLAVEERLALVSELRRSAEEAALPDVVAQSWQWEAIVQFGAGDLTAVEYALDELERINARLGLKYFQWAVVARRAGVALSAGALAAAAQLIRESVDLVVHDFSIFPWQIATLRWLEGRAAEIIPFLSEFDPERDPKPERVVNEAMVALNTAEAGDLARAQASLEAVALYLADADITPWRRSFVLAIAARAARLVGNGPWVEPLRAAFEPLAGLFAVAHPGVSSLGAIDGWRGALALTAGRIDEAIELLAQAVEQNGAAGLRPFVAIAQADLAEALSHRDVDAARRHAAEALELAREIGMAHVVRQVEELIAGLPASRSAIVGRDDELSTLVARLDRLSDGQGGLMLIGGQAGIGKTRLVQELASIADRQGVHVFWGDCFEGDDAPAFHPWLPVLRAAVATCPDVDASEVSRLIPDALPDVAPSPIDDDSARYRLFDAVAALLRVAGPALIVLDDLHWADAASLRLLEHVVRQPDTRGVFIVGTYRDDELDPSHPLVSALALSARLENARQLHLRALEAADIARLVDLRTDSAIDSRTRDAIVRRSDGIPLFATQLAAAPSLATEDEVPEGLRAVLSVRVQRLDADTLEVLEAAAVLGRAFDAELVAKMLDRSDEFVDEAIDRAARANLVEQSGRDEFRFVHALVRDALYDRLAPNRLRALHRTAAVTLGVDPAAPKDRASEIAQHWLIGGRKRDAETMHRAFVDAASQAHDMLAFEEAAHWYTQALAQERALDAAQRRDLFVALGKAQMSMSAVYEARATLLRAAELCDDVHDAQLLAHLALAYHGPQTVDHRDPEELALLNRAVRAMEAIGDPSTLAQLTANVASIVADEGDAPEGLRLSETAVIMADASGDPHARFAAHRSMFWRLFARPERTAEALAAAERSVEAADAVGSLEALIAAHELRFLARVQVGDRKGADADLAAWHAAGEASRIPGERANVLVTQSRALINAGRFEPAEENGAHAVALSDAAMLGFGGQLIEIRRWQGRGNEALPLVEVGRKNAPALVKNLLHLTRAALLCEGDAPEASRDEVADLVADGYENISQEAFRGAELALLAEIADGQDDNELAERVLPLLEPWGGLFLQSSLVLDLGPASLYIGTLQRLVGEMDDAVQHLEDAVSACDRAGLTIWLALAKVDLARTLLARGHVADREHAAELKQQALRTARELGLVRIEKLYG
jgi:predicted ATPase/pimeloyl-ACP methyl ester carboxylesterase/class 3 adenylate cyclase